MGARLRGIISLGLLIAGLFQAFSGILLFFAPHGRYSGNALIFGIAKRDWVDYHAYVGFILIAIAVVHLALNWRWFVKNLKSLIP